MRIVSHICVQEWSHVISVLAHPWMERELQSLCFCTSWFPVLLAMTFRFPSQARGSSQPDEEASFVYTSQESTWTGISSQCVSGTTQCRSRRTQRRRARRQREPMALSIKSETEPSGWSCLSGLAAQAVLDPQSVEEQALEVIQDLEFEASPGTLAHWGL